MILSIWEPMYQQLLPELLRLQGQQCRIKGITFGVAHPLPELEPHRFNEYMNMQTPERWFVLSVDGKELMYGHSAERGGNAYYTDDPVHIFLLEDYIWHDVLVNRLVAKGGSGKLDDWILPERERFFSRQKLPDQYWQQRKQARDDMEG